MEWVKRRVSKFGASQNLDAKLNAKKKPSTITIKFLFWALQKAAYSALQPYYLIEEQKLAKKDKITMPTSTAGLTRYFDDYKSKLSFKPQAVIVLVIVVIIIEILLHSQGLALLGI